FLCEDDFHRSGRCEPSNDEETGIPGPVDRQGSSFGKSESTGSHVPDLLAGRNHIRPVAGLCRSWKRSEIGGAMNAVHLHLLFNHFPTVGFCIGLALFVIALVRKHEALQQAGLVIFFVTAALTIATYVSGNDAGEAMKDSAGFPVALMNAHESAALVAFVFMQITGFFAW